MAMKLRSDVRDGTIAESLFDHKESDGVTISVSLSISRRGLI